MSWASDKIGGEIIGLAMKNIEQQHGINCAAWHNDQGDEVNGEDCTCGLRYRLRAQAEQAALIDWQERAEIAEATLTQRDNEIKLLKLAYGLSLLSHGCAGRNCTERGYVETAESLLKHLGRLEGERHEG